LTALNLRKQILIQPFVELFYATLEGDTVMYTELSDVVPIIQIINFCTNII